ncbi:MAG TPA: LysM peptidoglycan-binding domain-containing protein [Oligoflexus sp.]|uniref:LysM peptidoglycan-binding domain-containing protein n=1 Tax=Oligoflexus sp. TaxID=1971216 RepID=UPI002D5A72BA|nr:LysM peptidoglycan-binding domain-containing protein [Oligoflexus sp.]HYX39356.1 LysM peptidoglycan-binding domain-containing protein [Oligoflexus sp.]
MKLKNLNPLFLSLCVALPYGCSTTSHKEESIATAEVENDDGSVQPEVEPVEIDEALDDEGSKSTENVPEIGTEEDEINQALKNGIPIELNDRVEKWIDYFVNKNPEAFQRFMDRGQPYKKMVVAMLRDRGIPTELYYLAMIESGFVLHAKSPMSAVGFWQFIPATGRRYGLRVDNYVDERRDPRRATIAAAMYLSDLNNVFDSWYLALSAYNAGEMRIMNAIMRGKSRDFWQLVKDKQLPSETMDYIPKFMAAFLIGTNPEKYGFRRPTAEPNEDLVAVSVPSPISLTTISEYAGVPLVTLQLTNPHLNKGVTPPGTQNYKIWVPKAFVNTIQENQERLATARLNISTKVAAVEKVQSKHQQHPQEQKVSSRKFHRVKRGEHLAMIADKYGMTVGQLKVFNRLTSSSIRPGMKLKIKASEIADAGSSSKEKIQALASVDKKGSGTYRVRRGDNLNEIAKRFGMSVHSLKKMNKLRRTDLRVGQVLRVAKNS